MERGIEKRFCLNANVLKHLRALNRERVANSRCKKKLSNTEAKIGEVLPIFNSKQSFTGAVFKEPECLPFIPRKKKLVVEKLAKKVGIMQSNAEPETSAS